jgi:hypothetical protein
VAGSSPALTVLSDRWGTLAGVTSWADVARDAPDFAAPADHLVIESWHPGRGYERRARR